MLEAPKAGTKLRDDGTGVEVIVVKSPSEASLEIQPGDSVNLGKRYTCGTCEAQVIIVKAGPGKLVCHGATMEIAQAKALPSSD
nr:hypothetical protein [Micromonospora sp. DSM 115978]